jgi:hypothetical protein
MFGSTIELSDDVRRSMALLAVAAFCSVLSACTLRGPTFTPISHVAYNVAVQEGEQRELLLNIVRLRYLDRPEFLAISSISSQMHFGAQASLTGSFGDDQDLGTNLVVPGASVTYSESPTVIFSPQASEEFIRQLGSPVGLGSIYLLTRYGWSLDRAVGLIVEEVNGIRNLATREAMTPDDVETSRQFDQITAALQSLYERHLIDIDVAERWTALSERIPADRISADDLLNAAVENYRFGYDAETQTYPLEHRVRRYVVRVSPEAAASPEVAALAARLGVRPGQASYDIDSAESPEAPPGTAVMIKMRSLLSTMVYLSRGVDIPETDQLSSILGPNSLDEVFRVVSSEKQPTDALVAVPYRGKWFHIEANDVESRRTLGLMSSLLRLQVGAGGSQNVPVLTLPLSR